MYVLYIFHAFSIKRGTADAAAAAADVAMVTAKR